MKRKKAPIREVRLTGEQIVQKKLDEVNEMLRKADLSILYERKKSNQQLIR